MEESREGIPGKNLQMELLPGIPSEVLLKLNQRDFQEILLGILLEFLLEIPLEFLLEILRDFLLRIIKGFLLDIHPPEVLFGENSV